MNQNPDTSPLAGVFAPLARRETYAALLYLLTALPVGIALIVVLVTGWALGLGLLITVVGIPLILGLLLACRWIVEVDRHMIISLLDTDIAPLHPHGRRSVRAVVTDPGTWREQAYLVVRATLGFGLGVATLSLFGLGGQLMSLPLWYRSGEMNIPGVWNIDTLGDSLLAALLGAALVLLGAALVRPAGRLWGRIARGILHRPGAADADDPGPTTAGDEGAPTRRVRIPGGGRRGLLVHGVVWAGISLITLVIWAATTPGGYPWYVWAWLGLGLPLGIHAWVVLRPRRAGGRDALELHAGIMGILGISLLCIWLITTPSGYPWFTWAWLGLAIPPLVHLAAYVLRPGERAALAERVEVLTTTRAGAVDAQSAELQRIERDLHDGAQARLVALAMDLGRAEAQMDTDPDAARRIMNDAREQAARALGELRDLARGIYPPVLADRGLTAAITALAARGPLEVVVDGDLDERPAPAVEAAAYFVVAEALTNAAKHSGASRAQVRVRREGDTLSVEVTDPGAGGADAAGAGLTGLRRRVEALDGALRVASPDGGPTLVRAELPWGRPTEGAPAA